VWPAVECDGRSWRETDLGYADAIRKLVPGTVIATGEEARSGIRIVLETGTISIHPAQDEVGVEIAEISGWADHSLMVWRPGEEPFEDLA
jgi:hypothetical protein